MSRLRNDDPWNPPGGRIGDCAAPLDPSGGSGRWTSVPTADRTLLGDRAVLERRAGWRGGSPAPPPAQLAAEAEPCKQYAARAACDADASCTWCDCAAVPSSCWDLASAKRLPPSVYTCDSARHPRPPPRGDAPAARA